MTTRQTAGTLFHFDNIFNHGELRYECIDLFQIGEIWCECGYQVPSHNQYCLELSYIISGSGYFYVDQERIPVEEGDIFFNAPGHTHAIATSPSSTLRYVYMGFFFNEEANERFPDIRDFLMSAPYYHAKNAHILTVPFFRNLDEFFSPKPHSDLLVRNYIEQIIFLSCRLFMGDQQDATAYFARRTNSSVGSAVYMAMRYVDQHLMELDSIKTIAKDLGYSYTYLSHTFKNKTGMTLQRYINHKKAEKALELIQHGGMSIKEIAARLQYETPQAFNKAFVRIMGHPPSYYAIRRK